MASVSVFKPGMSVCHGALGVERDETIKHIVDYGHTRELQFESGNVTYVPKILHFDCNKKAQYFVYWRPGGCETKDYETISILE